MSDALIGVSELPADEALEKMTVKLEQLHGTATPNSQSPKRRRRGQDDRSTR